MKGATIAILLLLFAFLAVKSVLPVDLGAAESFAILAGTGITNTGRTNINGDIGSHPTPTMTGTATMTLNGKNHGGDSITQAAKIDLQRAYNKAANMVPTKEIVADLGGQTLRAGVYHSGSSIGLTGTLTLNGRGNSNSVFIFQAGSKLTTATASKIVLINGAQASNVFWAIGSSATLGTYSRLQGTFMAVTSITVTTGVVIEGRTLAINGAVTLDTNMITAPFKSSTRSKADRCLVMHANIMVSSKVQVGAVSVFCDGSSLIIKAGLSDGASTTLAIKSYRIYAKKEQPLLNTLGTPQLNQYNIASPSNFVTSSFIDLSTDLSALDLTCGTPFNFVLSLKLVNTVTGQLLTAWAIDTNSDISFNLLPAISHHQLCCP